MCVWGRMWLEVGAQETTVGPGGKNWGGCIGPGELTGLGERLGLWHLLKQCVVGAVQVEPTQVVPVGEDEKWLLICRQRVLVRYILVPPPV